MDNRKTRGPRFAEPAETGTPGIGDNVPPSEAELFGQNLDEQTKALRERVRDLQVGLARVPDEIDDQNASEVTDFIAQIKRTQRDAETRRKELKRPLDERARQLQDHFRVLIRPLEEMLEPVQRRYDAFVRERERRERERLQAEAQRRAEQERKAREEADRIQREAEARARAAQTDEDRRQAALALDRAAREEARAEEAAKAAQKAERGAKGPIHTRGDQGGVGYTTGRWVHEVIDLEAVPLHLLRSYLKPEAIDAAVRAYIRDHSKELDRAAKAGETARAAILLAGVRIYRETATRVRSA